MDQTVPMLNASQQEAVMHTEGPCMLIAGAGSGKTRVITHRIAHLIREKSVPPQAILALTFTNKAAGEMKRRVEQILDIPTNQLWIGTFHSLFARLLRVEAPLLGYPSSFSIYDREDSKSLIKALLKDLQLDEQIYRPDLMLARISSAKSRLMTAQMYANNTACLEDDQAAGKPRMSEIFMRYTERCKQAGAMDFDDLLLQTHQLFEQDPDVLRKYQERFHYILVDEFQDTNLLQYALLKQLAAVHTNLFVVGDDAQSIYAFRGANMRNLLFFRQDYPKGHLIKMGQNYRSTRYIVRAANSIIACNQDQLEKDVWTANKLGQPLRIVRAANEYEEANLVAQSIFAVSAAQQCPYSAFAVLYRANSQSRALEESLRRAAIPYRIVGGMSFYERKEVRDMLAYLRLLQNKNDEEALKRVINIPRRGIGPTRIQKLVFIALERGEPLWEVVRAAATHLVGAAGKAVGAFADMIDRVADGLEHKDAYEIAQLVANASGFLKMLEADSSLEGLRRHEHVQELLNAIRAFVDAGVEDRSLGAFLHEVSLVTGVDQADEVPAAQVKLMTIHAAKGLEFPHVYIVGMEEGIFPARSMLRSREDLEEERRLCYVALTRAEASVTLLYTLCRYRYGKQVIAAPSRFLSEIDPECLQASAAEGGLAHGGKSASGMLGKPWHGKPFENNRVTKPDAVPAEPISLAVGQRVRHEKFGIGSVKALSETGKARKALIDFGTQGMKTLLLSFAKLQHV